MKLALTSLLVLGSVLGWINAEPQYGFGYPFQNYFRAGYPQPSYDEDFYAQQRSSVGAIAKPQADARLFFTTVV